MRALFGTYRLALAAVMAFRSIVPAASRSSSVSRTRDGFVILATGTFFSPNWLHSHVIPILDSTACRRFILACDSPLVEHPQLENRCPPEWLRRLVRRVPARTLVFIFEAIRTRPDFVIGYHLIPNGLIALLVARLVGAKCIYQCCGGPSELDGGGMAMQENGLLSRLKTPDPVLAGWFRKLACSFDSIVTRGEAATEFFVSACGVNASVMAITAGVDSDLYAPVPGEKEFDVVSVGRLATVKRVDVLIDAVRILSQQGLRIRIAIVGDGPCRPELEAQVREAGLSEQVVFAGSQRDVASWLKRARVFVMTSDSEGLSIALLEAMMCGLPAVASRVGDLGTLVRDNETGFLAPPGEPRVFADCIHRLLADPERLSIYSRNARDCARTMSARSGVTRRWTELFAMVSAP